jgi:AbrB family looped-hinge helix DNA binding protein
MWRVKLDFEVSQLRRVRMKALVRLSSKGQLVIPKVMREKLKLTPQKPVIVELRDDYVVVKPLPNLRKTLRGSLKGKPSMSQALIREHQSEVTQAEKLSV